MNALRAALLTIFWALSFGWGRRWYRQFQLMAWRRKLMGVSGATSGAHVASGIGRTKRFSLLELMLDYSNQGLAMVDARGQVLIFNKRALEYTGVDPETFKLPATADEVRQWQLQNGEFGPEGSLLPQEVRSYFMTGHGRLPKSYVRRRPDGTVLEVRSEPLPGGGIVQSYTDITELTEAKEGAEAGARAKSAFLATMSHEVRTPLNGVLGVAALLRQTKLTEEQAEYVRIIAESGDALLTVINDVLDFSKLEAGMMQFDPMPASLQSVASGALDLVRASAANKGLRLSFEVAPDVPPRVLMDAKRVRQVLLNLASNAVKFTAEGSVTLKISRLAEPFAHHVRFEVHDTGIGIPPEGRIKLFKEFSQVDGSIDRQYGGTGLGLAICKKIVEAMKGTIGVDSHEGQGSCFWFEIPAPPAEEQLRADTAPGLASVAFYRSYRILVAEDVATNQLVARKMLESLGHVADIASDGIEALEHARQIDYDLIFMDMQMPGMNGLQATRTLRGYGGRFATVPVIAMTANTSASDEADCRDAGMNGFITKPLDIQVLSATIEDAIKHDRDHVPAIAATEPAGPRPAGAPIPATPATADDNTAEPATPGLADYLGPAAMNDILTEFLADAQVQLTDLAQHAADGDSAGAAQALGALNEGLRALGQDPVADAVWRMDDGPARVRQQVDAVAARCREAIAAASGAGDPATRETIVKSQVLDNLIGHIGPDAMGEMLATFIDATDQRIAILEKDADAVRGDEGRHLLNDIREGLLAFGLTDRIAMTADELAHWAPAVSLTCLRQQFEAAIFHCETAIAAARPSDRRNATAGACIAEDAGAACSEQGLSHGDDFICDSHLPLAASSALERKRQTEARLDWLRTRWDDQAYFDRVEASGRYFKLVEALRMAEEQDDLAFARLKDSVLRHSDPALVAAMSEGARAKLTA